MYISIDVWVPVLLDGLQSIIIITYFDSQIVPDLASGSTLSLVYVCLLHIPVIL